MLTADLVETRRRGDDLHLVSFEGERRALAEQIARNLHAIAAGNIGASREDLDALLATIEAPSRARKLVLGLRKVLDDASAWETRSTLDPEVVRRAVFERSAWIRRELGEEARFDRDAILAEVALELGSEPRKIEDALFADLRAAQILSGVELPHAGALVERYASEQVQAVLLRAVSVHVKLRCDGPGAYRALFARIKFLRLLWRLHAGEDGAYELDIDGPYSLFESVTKYGLQLAMLVPVLESARSYELTADVRWGRNEQRRTLNEQRRTLRFQHRGGGGSASSAQLSDEAQALLDDLAAVASPWRPRVSDAILELKGVGLCVPDIELMHRDTGEVVYVELMGFWSRDALFARKTLVERGLSERIVFVASSHLRVREELLADDQTGAIYVYKKVPSAKLLLERIEAVTKPRR